MVWFGKNQVMMLKNADAVTKKYEPIKSLIWIDWVFCSIACYSRHSAHDESNNLFFLAIYRIIACLHRVSENIRPFCKA